MVRWPVLLISCLFFGIGAIHGAETVGATRVISLAPSVTELICALGFESNLVGRTTACDEPATVRKVDVVGDFGRPNLEAILRLKPDFVVGTSVEKPAQLRVLEGNGISVLRYPCRTWDGLMDAARGLGDAFGSAQTGQKWVRKMEDARNTIVVEAKLVVAKRGRPSVFVEVWGDPLTTIGRDSFLTECIEVAGGRSISASINGGYPHVSMEWVLEQNPDVILLLSMVQGGTTEKPVARRPGWATVSAVKNGHIVTEWDPDLLLRPGPRLIDGMQQLSEYLSKMPRL